MAFQFTYVRCNNPDDQSALDRDNQLQASSVFQQYKTAMKETNDDPSAAPHFIEIGVTDDHGEPVEQYKHTCRCRAPYN